MAPPWLAPTKRTRATCKRGPSCWASLPTCWRAAPGAHLVSGGISQNTSALLFQELSIRTRISSFGEESFADELFGLTYTDAPNSILTNGAVDFGLLGVVAYPLLIVLIMRVSIEALSRFLPPLPMAIIILGAIFAMLQTETATSAYFVSIRNEIIFAIILFLYSRLPKFGLRRN